MAKQSITPIITVAPSAVDQTQRLVRKPNDVLVLMARDRGISAVARKLYSVLLWETQQQMRSMGRVPEATHLFSAPVLQCLELAGSSAGSYLLGIKHLREMEGKSVTWQSPESGSGIDYRWIPMLSQAEIAVVDGVRHARWMLPPAILTALLQPSAWTMQDLQILASLQSYTAIALYDICSRYRNNPGGLTHRADIEWWLAALSSTDKHREWRKVKYEQITPAVEEINTKTDLVVGLIEHKDGRMVREAQFSVLRRDGSKPGGEGASAPDAAFGSASPSPAAKPAGAEASDKRAPLASAQSDAASIDAVLAACEGLDVSRSDIEALLPVHGLDRLTSNVAELRRRLAVNWAPPIRNQAAYLRSMLDSSAPDPWGHPEIVEPSSPIAAPVVVDVVEQEPDPMRVSAELELDLASDAARGALMDRLRSDLQSRGLLRPAMAKRLATGDWRAPMVRAELVNLIMRSASKPDPDTRW